MSRRDAEPEEEPRMAPTRKTLLVVEDDPGQARLVERVFARA
jgi:hypothetical protein